MTTGKNGAPDAERLLRQPIFAVVLAAISAAAILFLSGRWFGSWGLLITAFVVMLGIEQIRRISKIGSLVRVGAAVGLLLGWLVYQYF